MSERLKPGDRFEAMDRSTAPMVGPATDEYCKRCGSGNDARGWAHLESCPTRKPSPTAPTGTPPRKTRDCEAFDHEGPVDAPTSQRIMGPGRTKMWLCDPCYVSGETLTAERHAKSKAPKPSQPPRWWSPAIESYGGVRPFGKPRGWR